VRRDAKLLGEYLPVARCLVEHIYKIRVLEDVFDLPRSEEVLAILRQPGRDNLSTYICYRFQYFCDATAVPKEPAIPTKSAIYQPLGRWDGIFTIYPQDLRHEKSPIYRNIPSFGADSYYWSKSLRG